MFCGGTFFTVFARLPRFNYNPQLAVENDKSLPNAQQWRVCVYVLHYVREYLSYKCCGDVSYQGVHHAAHIPRRHTGGYIATWWLSLTFSTLANDAVVAAELAEILFTFKTSRRHTTIYTSSEYCAVNWAITTTRCKTCQCMHTVFTHRVHL